MGIGVRTEGGAETAVSGGQVWGGGALMNVRGEQAISSGIHCSYALYPPFFFLHANSSLPPPPPRSVSLDSSSPHITSISGSRCVPKSHFLSHHHSAWPERLLLAVFIRTLSEFI